MASGLVVVALRRRCNKGTWSDFLGKLFLTICILTFCSIHTIGTIRSYTTLASTILQTITMNIG